MDKVKELEDVILRLLTVVSPISDYGLAEKRKPGTPEPTPKIVGLKYRMKERQDILELPLIKELTERRAKDVEANAVMSAFPAADAIRM